MMKYVIYGGLLSIISSASVANASCVASTERSLSYCSGVLGMLAAVQGQAHSYFEDDYLELIALKGDKQCGYFNNPAGLSEVDWAEFMQNAGKLEFEMLMQSQDAVKLQSTLGDCVSLFQAWNE